MRGFDNFFTKLTSENAKYYKDGKGEYIVSAGTLTLPDLIAVTKDEYEAYLNAQKKKYDSIPSVSDQLSDIMDAICELGIVVDQAIVEHEEALMELASIMEEE